MVQDGWMSLRLPWRENEDCVRLLSEPLLSIMMKNIMAPSTTRTLSTKLYFSYNSVTKQTTIFTTNVNQMHICMIEHLKELFATSIQAEGIVARLLLQYFVVAQECLVTSIDYWGEVASSPVCGRNPL